MSAEVDLNVIDEMLESTGRTAAMAIPLLQKVQALYRYVPAWVITYIAQHSDMTETQLYGVVTFYAQFRTEPVGETLVRVCHGTACHVAGAALITQALEKRLGVKAGETTNDMKYTLTAVACLGCCSLAPVVMVGDKTFGRLEPKKAGSIIDQFEEQRGAS